MRRCALHCSSCKNIPESCNHLINYRKQIVVNLLEQYHLCFTYDLYSLGSADVLFKSIKSCMCRHALRESCIAEQFIGGRLAGQMTPPLACLLYLHKRCMDNDVAGMLYVNQKINIYLQWKLYHSKTYQWTVITVQNISFSRISLYLQKIKETVSQPL